MMTQLAAHSQTTKKVIWAEEEGCSIITHVFIYTTLFSQEATQQWVAKWVACLLIGHSCATQRSINPGMV